MTRWKSLCAGCDRGSTTPFKTQWPVSMRPCLLRRRARGRGAYSFARAPENEKGQTSTRFFRAPRARRRVLWLAICEGSLRAKPIKLSGPLGRFVLDYTGPTDAMRRGWQWNERYFGAAFSTPSKPDGAQGLPVPVLAPRTQRDLYCLDEIELIKNEWHESHKVRVRSGALLTRTGTNLAGRLQGFVHGFFSKRTYLDRGLRRQER